MAVIEQCDDAITFNLKGYEKIYCEKINSSGSSYQQKKPVEERKLVDNRLVSQMFSALTKE